MKVLLLPFTTVIDQTDQLQKYFLHKVMTENWSQNLRYWLRNCLKLPRDTAGHSGGVSNGGFVSAVVGVSDM